MNALPLRPLSAATLALALLAAFTATLTQASVVITGTRVIYPGGDVMHGAEPAIEFETVVRGGCGGDAADPIAGSKG